MNEKILVFDVDSSVSSFLTRNMGQMSQFIVTHGYNENCHLTHTTQGIL